MFSRIKKPIPTAIGLAMLLALLVVLLAAPAASGQSNSLVINEIMQNPSVVSDSNGEWFEIYNAGDSTVDIDGWTIRDDDFDTHVINNGGPLEIASGGFLVLARNADFGTNGGVVADYQYSSFFLGNSGDEVILLDGGGNEIDRVEYDGGPDFPDPNGASMSLEDPALDNNVGANWCEAVTPFGDGDLGTPGEANICTLPATPLTIMEIQGAGHVSPHEGVLAETTGIVTGVAFDSFFVQDPDGDGNPATSDGMRVFMGSFCNGCPNVGDEVRLTDRIDEFIPGGRSSGNLSATEMSFPTIELLSTGNDLPDPVIIGRGGRIAPNVITISEDELPVNLQDVPGVFNPETDGIDFYESLEGMLVTVEDAVAVSAVRAFGNFSSELFVLPNNGHPEIISPNNVRTDRGGINLAADADGYGDTNPERVQIQFDASDIRTGTLFPSTVPTIIVGDRLGDVTGVVGYDFGNFEVRAIEDLSVTPSGLEPETTSLQGTRRAVSVASYNVLNLSPLAGDDNQRAKLANQIVNNLGSPDVIALQEIQDNNGTVDDGTTDATQTLQAFVDAIDYAGGPEYAFFDVAPVDGSSGGVPGGNIRNAFLYNPDRVELDGFVSLTPDVLLAVGADPDAFLGTRNPLAATFTFDRRSFTVINNHLSSRFGSTPIFGGPQPFVQAAEEDREAQVGALNDYVDYLLDDDKNARVIVTGDFNTFEFTDDLTEILPGTLDGQGIMKSLLTEVEDNNRYTFIFDGNSQVLDHMFATRSLLEGASFDIAHVNVDFSRLRLDTVASDHEPLVGLFDLWAK